MIEKDDIKDLEEVQEKLKDSDIESEHISEILGSLVAPSPSVRKLSASNDVHITQKSESVEIELQESVLQTDEGKEALAHLCKNSEATKKAVTSTLVLLEDKEEATHDEIREFSGYKDKSEISRACKELRNRELLEKDGSGEVDVVYLSDNWIENLIKLPELKRKQEEVLEYL